MLKHLAVSPVSISDFGTGDIERRLKFVDLGSEDRARIAAAKSLVLDHLDDHLAAFFGHLKRFGEAQALVGNGDIAVEALRLKREHLIAMVSGDFGRAYMDRRFRLGEIYGRANLEVSIFMGAFHALMASVGRRVMSDLPNDPPARFEHFISIKKVAFFDIGIIVDAMMAAREQTILRQQKAIRANAAASAAHEALKVEVAEREALSQELVEANRLASLGALVAGIAHELNTPIGNALMVSSSFKEAVVKLKTELQSGAVRRSSIDRFVQTSEEASRLLDSNLSRASEQISGFKQIAVDQTGGRWRSFNLKRTIEDVVRSFAPMVRQASVKVEIDINPDIAMEGYPGALTQVIVNLVENAVKHGLAVSPEGKVRITARPVTEAFVRITVSDNGVGIAEQLTDKVFDAFFTTKFGHGGTGLGLHIVKTLVTGPLGGTISLGTSDKLGARFVIDLPLRAPQDGGALSPELGRASAVR